MLLIQLKSVLYLSICEKRKKAQKERQLKNRGILNTNGMQPDVQCLACHIIVSMLCPYTSVPVSVLLLGIKKGIHYTSTVVKPVMFVEEMTVFLPLKFQLKLI